MASRVLRAWALLSACRNGDPHRRLPPSKGRPAELEFGLQKASPGFWGGGRREEEERLARFFPGLSGEENVSPWREREWNGAKGEPAF